MYKDYNAVVLIGRFEPPHNPHVEIMNRAYKLGKKVVVVIGSANEPRTIKNPFTANEREVLIREAFKSIAPNNPEALAVVQVENTIYDNLAWAVSVQEAVQPHILNDADTGIIGHTKDESSFYLKMFPQWTTIEQPLLESLHATQIREMYFQPHANLNFLAGVVPACTLSFLKEFQKTAEYERLVGQQDFIKKYKKQFEHLPYDPIFVTVDAVVIQSGHVLMVRRRDEPGKGLLALPGGFVNARTDKSIQAAMLRELEEETKIDVPQKVLIGNIKDTHVFDAIDRSQRGRTITHAFKIVLPDGEWKLPHVKGSDDAEVALWMPISKVRRDQCFEDHKDIIDYFVGKN